MFSLHQLDFISLKGSELETDAKYEPYNGIVAFHRRSSMALAYDMVSKQYSLVAHVSMLRFLLFSIGDRVLFTCTTTRT